MENHIILPSIPNNEPVFSYKKNSVERMELEKTIEKLKSKPLEIPMIIGGKEIFTEEKIPVTSPHNHKQLLGYYHLGGSTHVSQAIEAALVAKPMWEAVGWEEKKAIFLKAAALLSVKYRSTINAATMLGQSKTIIQAELDAACELIDFLRFNVYFASKIYTDQPLSSADIINRLDYRPLEGFVYAITPFNFTAIAGNLSTCPAMLGNTVVWKPSDKQIYSAILFMKILKEAGLPDGVINIIYTDPEEANRVVFSHPDFAGLHFTGSTKVFKQLWKRVANNIENYNNYPRIVGETGGKDFILAHSSAEVDAVVTALIRGAFEYQGQKCSAASRAYLPASLWPEIERKLLKEMKQVKMGSVEDFSHFLSAVIDEKAFDRIEGYIQRAKQSQVAKVIFGGKCDKSNGYFIEPTIVLVEDSQYETMKEEIFGPVLSIFIYQDDVFMDTLQLINTTSQYALTGAIFSTDRYIVESVLKELRYAAGNFYINDKPTGAVVGCQPFGGGRASGTNDKAGSMLNLLRWLSPRSIKENFTSPTKFPYPSMD